MEIAKAELAWDRNVPVIRLSSGGSRLAVRSGYKRGSESVRGKKQEVRKIFFLWGCGQERACKVRLGHLYLGEMDKIIY